VPGTIKRERKEKAATQSSNKPDTPFVTNLKMEEGDKQEGES